MKCKELMVGDFCRSGHGLPMQITNVGDDYAYATFEGNEGEPWEFDDKDYTPEPILLTDDILKRNRFEICGIAIWSSNTDVGCSYRKEIENDFITYSIDIEEFKEGGWFMFGIDSCLWQGVAIKYVHQIQQVLRLAGMTDLANNFKI